MNTQIDTTTETNLNQDINCGDIVDSGVAIADKGREIFEMILATASGTASKSERWGYGADEFVPWYIGVVM